MIRELNNLKTAYDFISEVRGKGFLCAVQFDSELSAQVVQDCIEQGLLVNPVKPNAIRFMPPLITPKEDVDEAINILKEVFAQVEKTR